MHDDHLPRRKVLKATGAAVPALLAGCSGGGSGDDGDGGSGDGGGGGSGDGGDETEGTETATETEGSASAPTLNVGQRLQPKTLDPIKSWSLPDALVGNRIFSRLYTYNEGTETIPNVAAGDPEITNDGTRWTVEIRDDVTFHNGDPLTAEDVKYSFAAPLEEETGLSSIFKVIDAVEVVDETTVQFDLKFPYAMFDDILTQNIAPKAVREEDAKAFQNEPVGSGPFKFVEWKKKNFVDVERWDDYWGEELPNVGGAKFTSITENTTRVTTLKTEKQDVIQTIPPKLWETVKQAAEINSTVSIGYYYAAFNMKEGPTRKKKVREAVDYGVSMDDAVDQFIKPTGVRQYGPLPEPIVEDWGFPADEWADYHNQKDVDEAKRLFDEAGVPDDWTATIIVPPDDNRENIGISIANGIKEAGYGAQVKRYDWGTFLNTAYTGNKEDYNIYILGWVRFPDPDDFMYNLFHEENTGVYQGVYHGIDELSRKVAEARRTTDREQRKQLYTDAIELVLENKIHIPSFNYKNSYGVNSYVEDFRTHPIAPANPRLLTSYNNVSVNR